MSAHPDVREQLERIKSITRRQGYESERGLQLESAGFKTLGGLLDMFASAGMTDTPNREEHKLRDVAMDPIPEARRQALEALYQRVEVRAADISGTHAWWPCRRGCDHCCRHLSAPLPLTELEWRYLWDGFQRLPAQAQAEVRARVAELERSGRTPARSWTGRRAPAGCTRTGRWRAARTASPPRGTAGAGATSSPTCW